MGILREVDRLLQSGHDLDLESECSGLIEALTSSDLKSDGDDELDLHQSIHMINRFRSFLGSLGSGGFWNDAFSYLLTNWPMIANYDIIKRNYYENRAKYMSTVDDRSRYMPLAETPGDAFHLIKKHTSTI